MAKCAANREKWWRSGPPSLSPGRDELHRLYVEEQMSLAEIACRLNVTRTSVSRWLKAAGISTRSISEATILSGKYGVHSESHSESLRNNAAVARSHITAESRAKQSATRKARKITPWNKGRAMSEEQKEKLRIQRADPEYRERQADRQRGDKSPNWRGGVATANLRSPQDWKWKQRRAECYERDDWTCQDCGVKCGVKGPRRIQAHHIIARRNGGSDKLSNLVTLCASCHHKREARGYDALFA